VQVAAVKNCKNKKKTLRLAFIGCSERVAIENATFLLLSVVMKNLGPVNGLSPGAQN
jgi:hypothetical protein